MVVRDPAPRYLDAPVLINDALRVGAVTVDGESPRAATVAARCSTPARRSPRLGVRWVLVRTEPGVGVPPGVLAGLRLAYDGPYLALWENPRRRRRRPRPAGAGRPLAAHLLAALVVIFAAIWLLRGRRTFVVPSAHS